MDHGNDVVLTTDRTSRFVDAERITTEVPTESCEKYETDDGAVTNVDGCEVSIASSGDDVCGGVYEEEEEDVHNILCLGVSYPCIQETLKVRLQQRRRRKDDGCHRHSNNDDTTVVTASSSTSSSDGNNNDNGRDDDHSSKNDDTNLSQDDVIDAVEENVLTQMDGRDLLRIVATERRSSTQRYKCYTVSQENGAIYNAKRHYTGNFNRSNFIHALQKHLRAKPTNTVEGTTANDSSEPTTSIIPNETNDDNDIHTAVQFRQIILDYYWIPKNWDACHWTPNFFRKTIPDFAKYNVLSNSNTSCIYIPFCLHCLIHIIGLYTNHLQQYYTIRFIRKYASSKTSKNDELLKIALYAGTQQIASDTMQHVMGKHIAQEDTYCRVTLQEIMQYESNQYCTKTQLLDVVEHLHDFHAIRFLQLVRVPTTTNSSSSSSSSIILPQTKKGTIEGLVRNKRDVQNGIHPYLPSSTTPPPSRKRKLFHKNSDSVSPSRKQRTPSKRSSTVVPRKSNRSRNISRFVTPCSSGSNATQQRLGRSTRNSLISSSSTESRAVVMSAVSTRAVTRAQLSPSRRCSIVVDSLPIDTTRRTIKKKE